MYANLDELRRQLTKSIAQRELGNDDARVIDEVVSGQTFLVTRNGVRVAELRPVQQPRRTFVPKAELQALAATGPHLGAVKFRCDLDRAVDQSREISMGLLDTSVVLD